MFKKKRPYPKPVTKMAEAEAEDEAGRVTVHKTVLKCLTMYEPELGKIDNAIIQDVIRRVTKFYGGKTIGLLL